MTTFKFRKYQSDAIAASMLYINGPVKTPGIVVAPTGTGKSFLIAGIAKKHKGPIIVLQPSKELLEQNFGKFKDLGGKATIYSASAGKKNISHVTYGTIGSIKKAIGEIRKLGKVLLIVDECHFGVNPNEDSQFMKFVNDIKPYKSIGLTATPFRLHNNSGGSQLKMLNRTRPSYYKHFIYVMQIQEAIDMGYWAPSENIAWNYDDGLLRRNSTGSDYTDKSVIAANEANNVNNNIYVQVQELLANDTRKSILVFCDSVNVAKKFSTLIPDSGYVTGDMSKKERTRVVNGFKDGSIKVVFNYGTLTTGFDHPELDTVICGRPIGSMAVFYQIYGRGCRVHPDKENFLFIDACGNLNKLGHPTTLTVENCPYNGWSLYSGDRLMSGVLLCNSIVVTRQDLMRKGEKKILDPGKFTFGKFKGEEILHVAKTSPWYIKMLIDNNDDARYGVKRKHLLMDVLEYVKTNRN